MLLIGLGVVLWGGRVQGGLGDWVKNKSPSTRIPFRYHFKIQSLSQSLAKRILKEPFVPIRLRNRQPDTLSIEV